MKEILDKVAGLDVHKKTVVACIMIGKEAKIIKKIKTFQTTTSELHKLAKWIESYNIKEVALESTGIYWVPVFNILEKKFNVILVNPKHMKNIPGKKTDVKDAEWICQLLKFGLLKASFIPEKQIRDLRDLTRIRRKYTQQKTAAINRIIKALESCNIKLKSVVSRIDGVAGWSIVKAISRGQKDPKKLAKLVTTHVKESNQNIIEALTGNIAEHNIWMIQLSVEHVEFCNKQIESVDIKIQSTQEFYTKQLELIRTFPGIGKINGVNIISEIGINMNQFPTEKHLASWAGLAPGNNESAGKKKSTRISPGNKSLKVALLQTAWSAVREKDGYWRKIYYRLKARLGVKKAIVAVARKILSAIYASLKLGRPYEDLGLKEDPEQINRSIKYYTEKLKYFTDKAAIATVA